MKRLFASDKVYLGKSKTPGIGRGVFAKCDIKKGEVVETCPMIELVDCDNQLLEKSILATYVFFFGKNKERVVLALGFGSIYNHSYKPNITYKIKPKEKLIDFIALCDIGKDDELTFDYHTGGDSKDKNRPLWFEKE